MRDKKPFDFLRQEKMWKGMPMTEPVDTDPMPKWLRVVLGLIILISAFSWIGGLIYYFIK